MWNSEKQQASYLSLILPRMHKTGLQEKTGWQDMPSREPTLNRLQGGDALCISDYAELQDASIPKRGSQCGLLHWQRHAHGRVIEPDAARLSPRDLAVLAVNCHNPAHSKDTVSPGLCIACALANQAICCRWPEHQWSGHSCRAQSASCTQRSQMSAPVHLLGVPLGVMLF